MFGIPWKALSNGPNMNSGPNSNSKTTLEQDNTEKPWNIITSIPEKH